MGKALSLGTIPTIEIEIYQREDAFFPSLDTRLSLQKQLLIESFEYHYNNNQLYKDFCDVSV